MLIKIEPNEILRGSVYPCENRNLSSKIENIFQRSISDMPVLSFPDLYGGKICAALSRQHPRDLFDVKLLFDNEGITDAIRQAFVIYLASSPRPVHELLNPHPNVEGIRKAFEEGFVGMTEEPISYDELLETRHRLIRDLLKTLTLNERRFLLSIKMGKPDWSRMPIKGIENLPGLAWKAINIKKMDKKKHEIALENLKKVLELS